MNVKDLTFVLNELMKNAWLASSCTTNYEELEQKIYNNSKQNFKNEPPFDKQLKLHTRKDTMLLYTQVISVVNKDLTDIPTLGNKDEWVNDGKRNQNFKMWADIYVD